MTRRARAMRQRAQNVIEFGAGIAAVAFVALVGFTALGNAQQTYWGAVTPSLAAPTPAPGVFLHPTSTDVASCSPSLAGNPAIVTLGIWIDCDVVVIDTFSDPYARQPPLGTITWSLVGPDAQVLGTCNLGPASTGAPQSSCAHPGLHWMPPANFPGHADSLVTTYLPSSNHQGSTSSPVNMFFQSNIVWNVSCVNTITGSTTSVEVGHPERCTANIQDWNTGSQQAPPDGTEIRWSTTNGGADPGVGMFTCASPWSANIANDLHNCPKPDIFSDTSRTPEYFSCYTLTVGASGQCSVIYRRLYDGSFGAVGSSPVLALDLPSLFASSTYNSIQIVNPPDLHNTGIVATCTASSPPTTVNSYPSGDPHITFGNALFQGSESLEVQGSNASNISCTVTVYDTNSGNNNPTVQNGGNPDQDKAYPPMGTVHFDWFDGNSTREMSLCRLVRVDMSVNSPKQAIGQAPFISSCPAESSFAISSAGIVNPQPRLIVQYDGEPSSTVTNPGHAPATFTVDVNFL